MLLTAEDLSLWCRLCPSLTRSAHTCFLSVPEHVQCFLTSDCPPHCSCLEHSSLLLSNAAGLQRSSSLATATSAPSLPPGNLYPCGLLLWQSGFPLETRPGSVWLGPRVNEWLLTSNLLQAGCEILASTPPCPLANVGANICPPSGPSRLLRKDVILV